MNQVETSAFWWPPLTTSQPWRSLVRRHPLQRGVDYKLVEEVRKSDPSFVREARTRYLTEETGRRRADLAADAAFAKSRTWPETDLCFLRLIYRDNAKVLRVLERELRGLSRPERPGRLTEDQIEQARRFPITQLLDKRVGEKVICPGHTDKTASCLVYEDHVHCYSCGFHADAIDWLRKTRDLTFIQAVRALL